MRQRCRDPKAINYHRYGGRGIRVCDRWDDFWLFVEDMGECPRGYTLDRIDGSLGYTPENCCWSSPTHQTRTRAFFPQPNKCSDTPYISRHSKLSGYNLAIVIRPGERFTRYLPTYEEAEELRDICVFERDFYRYVGR